MDPSFPVGVSGVAPPPDHAPSKPLKEKKAKKKKKHHKHEKEKAMQEGGIKLKIKVGQEGSSNPLASSSGHKKKKKKDKKKKDKKDKHKHHKRKREAAAENAAEGAAPPIKKIKTDAMGSPAPANEPLAAAHTPQVVQVKTTTAETAAAAYQPPPPAEKKDKVKPLYKLLSYILPRLEKLDANKFFALPVSDKFAPGYSQIIKVPMDFHTMRNKLINGEYAKLDLFQKDFELMCDNAMTYNTQETIYYKTAKKLRAVGKGLLTQQRLISMREQMPFMEDLTEEELGFDIMSENNDEEDDEDEDARDVSRVIEDIREVVRRPPGRFEAIPDDLSSQEILDQARKAAAAAADRLKLHRPRSQMGFLRQKPDGSTSLNFLTGGDGILPGTQKDRPVSLGELIGKVKQGTGSIQGFREDRRNVSKSVYPLYYGAFSSHGPTYDSTFANITKEETEMVYSTYGDEVGVQYAESILNFSRNCDYAMFIVDHLLDILTGNEHRKTSKYIEEKKNLRREDELMDDVFKGNKGDDKNDTNDEIQEVAKPENKVDFDSLKSLANEGIDMSFLDGLKAEYEANDPETMLKETAKLIQELKDAQTKRLSQAPPQHFAQMPKASDEEMRLSTLIQNKLAQMANHLTPADVVPAETVKMMLGIPVKEEEPDCVQPV